MKRLPLLLSLALFLLAAVLAAEPVRLSDGDNTVSVLSSTPTETILQFNVSHFEKTAVQIAGNTWYHVTLPSEGISQELGAPELPVCNRSVIIPDQSLMRIEVLDVQFHDLELPVAPSRGIITRDQDPASIPYTFGAAYTSDSFIPANIADLSEPYILRDFRGITLQTSPLAYNPANKTLRVYTSYKVRIYSAGLDSRNTLNLPRGAISRDFSPLYENHFANWYSYRYTPVSDAFGKLLVICHTNYMSAILPWVNWKKQKGIETELVEWSTIGTTAAQLQTYIQNRYNADNTLAYVQIVGDAPQIPSLTSGGGGSDPSFSLVAGSDNYPDIFIGRFSAQTVAELTPQINKAIVYERDLNTSATWLARATGLASAEGGSGLGDNGESDIAHMNLIRTDLLNYGYSTVDQIYDPGALASTVTANVNAGRGFINYVGHGSDTSWVTSGFSNTNASALTNGNMTPFIMDVACVNGNFVSITCFAEAWLRNANGGAVAMYASSINQSWNSPMRAQDEATDLLVAGSKTTAGGLYYNASCKMMDIYGNTAGSDGVNMFKTWHIFGDASLLVRSKTPLAMTVTHPAQIVIGATSINVSTSVPNTLVALTYNNAIHARGYTDSAGNVALTLVNPPAGSITYTLTATAFNRVSYIGSVQQVPGSGPYLAVTAATYSDANNGAPEYNESGNLDVTFQNIGSASAGTVTATLACVTPGITLNDSSEAFSGLAAGASTTINSAYAFAIADNVADGTSAAFTIIMTSGSETWNHTFGLTLNAPALAFGTMAVSDPAPGNNNGRLDPGETATISIPLDNTGGALSPSGTASLASTTEGITVNTASVSFTAIAASGTAVLNFSVTADSTIPIGTQASFTFSATAGAYSGNASQQTEVGTPPVILGSGTGITPTNLIGLINITFKSVHGQAVYTAAELTAAGVTGPISITQLGFYIASQPNLALPNFRVRMKHTTAANVADWVTATGMATVYLNPSYMPTAGGYEMLTLNTPFVWNGTDNIVIDTAFDLVSQYSHSGTWQYTTATSGYRRTFSDTANQADVFSGGSTNTYRPNVKLAFHTEPVSTPLISVDPLSLDFGAVAVGASAAQTFTILNNGTQTLTGSITTPAGYSVAAGARTAASAAAIEVRNTLGFSIPEGGSQDFELSFSPTSTASYTGSVVITSNAANAATLNVAVSGNGVSLPIGPRYVAEWEPAQGAIVRYPLGLPYTVLSAMSNNALLYVVVASASQSTCNSALSSNGVNMANVRYINATTDSYWVRDYGPWTIFNADNEMQIVDFTYNRPRPNDDVIPVTVANYLGLDYYTMPLTATGGNVMADGNGAAMSTNLILEENSSLTQAQIDALALNYLGVTDYQFYTDPNNTYIDHIDCWGKLLDVDKVLIRSVPASHAQYDEIEAVVDDWESRVSSYGTPYQIFRVYTPNNEPYTNSYIMNHSIYVPLMGNANDAAALAAYQNAMPGYSVTGYTHTSWESTDALHCRVNTVFDAQMIHAWHVPPASIMSGSSVAIDVRITHANALVPAQCYVAYRYSTTGAWQYAPLSLVSGNDWTASVIAPALGQTLYYYILATDTTARTALMPLCGSSDPFEIVVTIPSGNHAPTINLPESFSFPLNGSLVVDFSPYVDDEDGDDLTLTYSGNTNVLVSINGLTVTLSATADWIGTENLIFNVSDGSDSASDTASINVYLDYLAAPSATVTQSIPGTLRIVWDAIPHALSYAIWACDTPDGFYSHLDSTTELFWDAMDLGNPCRFYKVLATDNPLTGK